MKQQKLDHYSSNIENLNLSYPETGDAEGRTYAIDMDDRKKWEAIINALVGTNFEFISLLNLRTGTVTEYGDRSQSHVAGYKLKDADYTAAMKMAVRQFIREDKIEEAIQAHSIETIKAKLAAAPYYLVDFPTQDNKLVGWRIGYLDSNCDMILITRRDVTAEYELRQREAQQEQLLLEQKRQSEQYQKTLHDMIEAIPESVCTFMTNLTRNTCELRYSRMLYAAQRLQAPTVDGVISKLQYIIPDPKHQQAMRQVLGREASLAAFAAGQTQLSCDYQCLGAGGQLLWNRTIISMFRNPDTGDVEGVVHTVNIDKQKNRELIMNELVEKDYSFVALADLDTRTVTEYGSRKRSATEGGPLVDADYLTAMTDGVTRLGREDKVAEAIEAHRLETIQAKLAADKANQAKSNFLNGMSHDLRTPLNGIMAFTRLAIQTDDLAKKADYLEKIKNSGELLTNLVSDTLELSRIESGKLILQPEIADGKHFWESLVTALVPAAEMKGVRLETNPELYPEEMIKVDQLQVKKILLNLISNAIKYTRPGGCVKVSVQALQGEEHGYTRCLIVEDTGIDMSREFMERMYEPFSQEHRYDAGNVVGTGLGLSIIKRIVDLMQGRITVESEIDVGTRFVVELPIKHWRKKPADLERAQAEEKRREEQALAVLSGKRVLLCEDNYLNAEISTLLLKEKKMDVDWAKDGQQAVTAFEAAPLGYYDIILMDVRMPVMDGYEAAKALRRLDRSDAATVPIITMTANAFEEDVNDAREAGMNAYVTKPIDPKVLYKTLSQCVIQNKSDN